MQRKLFPKDKITTLCESLFAKEDIVNPEKPVNESNSHYKFGIGDHIRLKNSNIKFEIYPSETGICISGTILDRSDERYSILMHYYPLNKLDKKAVEEWLKKGKAPKHIARTEHLGNYPALLLEDSFEKAV